MSKNVGHILKLRRNELKLSITDLSNKTDVKRSFIENLESSNYAELPAEIYVKSILFRLAKILDLDAQFVYSKYIKENKRNRKKNPTAQSQQVGDFVPKQNKVTSTWFVTPKHIGLLVGGVIIAVLLFYFYFQASKLFSPPDLEINEPINESEVEVPVLNIKGSASINADVSINGQMVELSQDGTFDHEINLVNGVNSIKVIAANRLDKITERIINVSYTGPEDLLVETQNGDVTPDEIRDDMEVELQVKVLSSLAQMTVVIDDDESIERVVLRDGEVKFKAKSKIKLTLSDDNQVELIYNDQYLGTFPVESKPNDLSIIFEKEGEVEEESSDDPIIDEDDSISETNNN